MTARFIIGIVAVVVTLYVLLHWGDTGTEGE